MKNLLLSTSILSLSFMNNSTAQLPTIPEDISPLLVGETVPNVPLTSLEGASISVHDIIKEKPTILIYYRGGWCPYCNLHLSAIGRNEMSILELGYQIVAVSPDKIENLEATAEKDSIQYHLFSDPAGIFAKEIGIAFQAPEKYIPRLFESSGEKNTGFMPVPSVFVLDTKGEIQFEYINPNYKKRLSGELLLAVLGVLKAEE